MQIYFLRVALVASLVEKAHHPTFFMYGGNNRLYWEV